MLHVGKREGSQVMHGCVGKEFDWKPVEVEKCVCVCVMCSQGLVRVRSLIAEFWIY